MKPEEGWLPLLLLAIIVLCLVSAVLEASWVPEDHVVILAAVGGLVLGSGLAKRPLSALAGGFLITVYGWLIVLVQVAALWPSWRVLQAGRGELRRFWLQNGALFLDRAGSWLTAVFNNQTSQETIIFALGLGLATYFSIAFTSWQIFRQQRPVPGLAALGLALALNSYFGGVRVWWLGLFVGLAAVMLAVMHVIKLETNWQTNQVDYSEEVRGDLLVHAVAIAVIIFSLAVNLPGVRFQRLAAAFQERPWVQRTEQFLERAFGGVEGAGRNQPAGQDGVGGSGILPRGFLLGDAPELYETVVMTAVVQSEANLSGIHWRALSYDVYTGSGWALSEERSQPIQANHRLSLPTVAETAVISQTVYWVQDERQVRYSLGEPQQFDQAVSAIWRGQADLVRVHGTGSRYAIQSRISQAAPHALRNTAVDDVPPALLARYTTLPGELPQRVLDLAQEITANQSNPYDQARAIEQFLRQYPYSLDIAPPPADADPVDFFLFDQQIGYCDYYASAMVVLARAAGLPARIGIGFLPQPPDSSGVQVVYQINGHSWAEVYFAGYGWVEFEPTAAFSSPHTAASAGSPAGGSAADEAQLLSESAPLPLPPPAAAAERPFNWLALVAVSGAAGIAVWLWRQAGRPGQRDIVVWGYGRLQQSAIRLGQPLVPSQTPSEFTTAFQALLRRYGRLPRLTRPVAELHPHLEKMTDLYNQRIYAGKTETGAAAAWQSWQKVKRPLWLLRIVRKIAIIER